VIVPFAGRPAELGELLAALEALDRAPGDELIVADNRRERPAQAHAGAVRVIAAAGVASPGFARNRAAAVASGEWLVMIDADTHPARDLIGRYLEPAPGPDVGILAGGIDDVARGGGRLARHLLGRAQMSQETTLGRGRWRYAQTANMAVRREAFVAVGGFAERARAGEDADLCFRLLQAGWALEPRPQARVAHRARETLPALAAQLARHGAGAAWCERRHPGSFPPPSPSELARRLASSGARALSAAARGRGAEAQLAALELLEACAFEGGRLLSNRAR
jgi:GT2 family glycosyltransferase